MRASAGEVDQSSWGARSRLGLVALSMAGLAMVVGCSDRGDDDLAPAEPEVGEQDREVVPGEGGPVD
ncbi:MAG: hypothetical protein M3N37_00395 [Actinomycetota bacterium]|nr:hypothetical protein [Actinomycetota bacterium]